MYITGELYAIMGEEKWDNGQKSGYIYNILPCPLPYYNHGSFKTLLGKLCWKNLIRGKE